MKRACTTPFYTQRRQSSGDGFGPAKPPMSCPQDGNPHNAKLNPCALLPRRVFQFVKLSPVQVWQTNFCAPGDTLLEITQGRSQTFVFNNAL